MKIKISYLKAMLLFAGKFDIRFYLNGVHVKGDKMIATDGHRLTVCRLDGDSGLDVIIPTYAIEAAIALHQKMRGKRSLNFKLEVTADRVGEVFYTSIEGKYPDWKKVVPKIDKMEVDFISFNAGYLGDYAKMSRYLGNRHPSISIRQAKQTEVAVVDIENPDFLCLLMPTRFNSVPSVPAWVG